LASVHCVQPAGLRALRLITEVSRSLRRRAKRKLGLASVSHTGAVAVVQRAVHVHALALDGVYVRDEPNGPLVFHALPAPTREEVEEPAARTARRVTGVRVSGAPRRSG
jgi:hypothetical protein